MRLLEYGMIGLNGSVARPEPSATFADYQNSLANYKLKLNYRRRVAEQPVDITDAESQPMTEPDGNVEDQV